MTEPTQKLRKKELCLIAENCFKFPKLSTENEDFVGQFMLNHESIAAAMYEEESRHERSERTVCIMEDANIIHGLLLLKPMTMAEISERISISPERLAQAMKSMKKQNMVTWEIENQTRHYSAV